MAVGVDAGGEGPTCFARPESKRAETGHFIFPVQLTTRRIGNSTRLMPSVLKLMANKRQLALYVVCLYVVLMGEERRRASYLVHIGTSCTPLRSP